MTNLTVLQVLTVICLLAALQVSLVNAGCEFSVVNGEANIPSGVTEISLNAFNNCSGLTTVHIHAGITTIQSQAFMNNPGLVSLTFDSGSKCDYIGALAFSNTALKTVILPASLIEMSTAFQNINTLATLQMNQASLAAIREDAFLGCISITHLSIGITVKTIEDYAFRGLASLRTIAFATDGDNEGILETIGVGSFADLPQLTDFGYPPSTLVSIGQKAFQNTPLEYFNFAQSSALSSIGANAFQATQLKAFYCPNSLETIGNYAFSNIATLTVFELKAGSILASVGTNAFEFSPIQHIFIPKLLTTIQDFTFQSTLSSNQLKGLQSITFETGSLLTSIGDYAFLKQDKFETIVIPPKVSTIGIQAFYDCEELTTMTFAAHCATEVQIGFNAIANTDIQSISLPPGASCANCDQELVVLEPCLPPTLAPTPVPTTGQPPTVPAPAPTDDNDDKLPFNTNDETTGGNGGAIGIGIGLGVLLIGAVVYYCMVIIPAKQCRAAEDIVESKYEAELKRSRGGEAGGGLGRSPAPAPAPAAKSSFVNVNPLHSQQQQQQQVAKAPSAPAAAALPPKKKKEKASKASKASKRPPTGSDIV